MTHPPPVGKMDDRVHVARLAAEVVDVDVDFVVLGLVAGDLLVFDVVPLPVREHGVERIADCRQDDDEIRWRVRRDGGGTTQRTDLDGTVPVHRRILDRLRLSTTANERHGQHDPGKRETRTARTEGRGNASS